MFDVLNALGVVSFKEQPTVAQPDSGQAIIRCEWPPKVSMPTFARPNTYTMSLGRGGCFRYLGLSLKSQEQQSHIAQAEHSPTPSRQCTSLRVLHIISTSVRNAVLSLSLIPCFQSIGPSRVCRSLEQIWGVL